jgi:hypothetical protein
MLYNVLLFVLLLAMRTVLMRMLSDAGIRVGSKLIGVRKAETASACECTYSHQNSSDGSHLEQGTMPLRPSLVLRASHYGHFLICTYTT